ncbi:hybrid sensor histidine kinase/response regulator [Desulfonema magnum]|uniref:Sensory/regulatory protein RpfC n=1 Tax=Desulfonema magnum TaxID=45655 RepID=A0A975BKU5_9BACT|nr:response regulator [Desulfonema magnum]QTA87275.1 Two component system response regulator/histidine kinase, HAMP domain-containing [Desulfonema magnum]
MSDNASEDKISVKRSIKWKLIAIMMVLMACLVAILTYTQISSQKEMLEDELNKRISLIKENLIERGKSLIADLVRQVENDIASFNFSGAMKSVRDRVENNEEIKYAVLMDTFGVVLIHTLISDPALNKLTERDIQAIDRKRIVITEFREGNESVIEIVKPVQISTKPWGVLRLICSLKHLDKEIETSRSQIQQEIKKIVYKSTLTSLGFMAVCFVIVFILSASVLKPLILLTHSARKLSKGDFSVSSNIRVRSKDEVGVLGTAFIEMSKDLKRSYEKLEEYSKTLEQKVAERTRELGHKNIRLNKALMEVETARKDAETANRAKGDFLANMSHEIRTPMNAIINMTNLALRNEISPKTRNYLNTVRTSAHSLLVLINDILDISKIEAGKLHLESVDFQLHDVTDNLADMFSEKVSESGIELVILIDDDVPCALVGDPLRFGQILINLVNNAIKFTDKGEIIVSVSLVEKNAERATLRTAVSDTGIGISREILPRLFTSFTQADSSITRKFGGTGLGLAICKQLAEMMNGEAWAESEPDLGSTFYFTASLARQRGHKEKRHKLPADLQGMKALVADGKEASLKVLENILKSFTFDVTLASFGQQVLEILAETDTNSYDLVIVDQRMPDSDGTEIAKKIREDLKLTRIPVIITTNFGEEGSADQAGGIPKVNSFLVKPVKPSLLFDIIMEVFGQESPRESEHEETAKKQNAVTEKIRGANVLLVEDNIINQQVATEVLRIAGVSSEVAGNGKQAIQFICRGMPEECPYDAVLMDVQMPEIDGFEATRIIRNWENALSHKYPRLNIEQKHSQFSICRIPIIAMTAHVMKGDQKKCIASGMDDYVAKPINTEELYSVLAKWIKPKAGNPLIQQPEPETQQASAASQLPATAKLSGIDTESALKRFMGNKKLFKKLLSEFSRDYKNTPDNIRAALKKGDIRLAQELTHAIKGVAGNLSAQALYMAAIQLESGIKQRKTTKALNGLLEDFEYTLTEILDSVKKSEAEDGKTEFFEPEFSKPQFSDNSKVEILPLLVELSQMLLKNNPKAESYLNSMKAHLDDLGIEQEIIIQLENQINRFNFKSALKTLSDIEKMTRVLLQLRKR